MCFIQGRRLRLEEVVRRVRLTYPYVRAELFLRWSADQLEGRIRSAVTELSGLGLLSFSEDGRSLRRPRTGSERTFQLMQLGMLTLPMIQRYYMTIALLERYGSGRLSDRQLVRICELSAERLSMVYTLRSPEFFDRRLFQGFIATMQAEGVLETDADGRLLFDETLSRVERQARQVLGEQVRHSILSITVGEAPPVED